MVVSVIFQYYWIIRKKEIFANVFWKYPQNFTGDARLSLIIFINLCRILNLLNINTINKEVMN
jgi:hypothetical protein